MPTGTVPHPAGAQGREGLISERSEGWLLSDGVNTNETHRRPTKFSRKRFPWKHCQLELKESQAVQNENGPLDPRKPAGGKEAERMAQLQTRAAFPKREGEERGAQKAEREPPPKSSDPVKRFPTFSRLDYRAAARL